MSAINHRMLLRMRPTGIPQSDCFVADRVPVRPPDADEVLLETMYLSIDPAMRSWMSGSLALGEVMRGGGIARVLQSRSAEFQPGELVQARLGWQTHPTLPAKYLQKVDEARGDALAWIGPLGLSAVTAYFGMRDIGSVKPGDRVLVSAAAGGVGQIAAQIAPSRRAKSLASPAERRSALGSPTSCCSMRSLTTRRGTISQQRLDAPALTALISTSITWAARYGMQRCCTCGKELVSSYADASLRSPLIHLMAFAISDNF